MEDLNKEELSERLALHEQAKDNLQHIAIRETRKTTNKSISGKDIISSCGINPMD